MNADLRAQKFRTSRCQYLLAGPHKDSVAASKVPLLHGHQHPHAGRTHREQDGLL